MKLLVDDDVEWAQIINNWLEEQKFFTNASFFQNEMIYADFFSGSNTQKLKKSQNLQFFCVKIRLN